MPLLVVHPRYFPRKSDRPKSFPMCTASQRIFTSSKLFFCIIQHTMIAVLEPHCRTMAACIKDRSSSETHRLHKHYCMYCGVVTVFLACCSALVTFEDTLASYPEGRPSLHTAPYLPSRPHCLAGSLAVRVHSHSPCPNKSCVAVLL